MSVIPLHCRSATVFAKSGGIDEEAFRSFLQRFVDAQIGVYLASGGSGEGCALSYEELGQVYRIGVEVCKGKVFVGSNQPDQHTAVESIIHAKIAIDAGVDVVNIYGPASWHGYRSNDTEYLKYFDRVLSEIDYPVALCPNATVGYSPSPSLMVEICHRYPQVVSINLSGVQGDLYFINLKNIIEREIEIYVAYPGSLSSLELGASGLLSAEANFVPKTFRKYLDHYQAGHFNDASAVYGDLRRVTQFLESWMKFSPRLIKLAMAAFNLPGWRGGVREPYLMADQDMIKAFAEGALQLNISEINDMGRSAGLL